MGKPGSSKDKESSKSDRKLEKKVQFYSKVKDTVAALNAKKTIGKKKLRSRQKKLKAYDLKLLTEFLPDVNGSRPSETTNLKLNSKTRPKLLAKEGKQFKAVINNPTFQLDPLAAIQQHLESTQPPVDPVVKPRKKVSRTEKKKKAKQLKAAAQSMEI